jgi:hypothetical protein
VKKVLAAIAVLVAALSFGAARASAGGLIVGVNDDAGKYEEGAGAFWSTMKGVGLQTNAMTVLWDETRPTTIIDEGFIRNSLPAAAANGISVAFDVYPMHSRAFTSGDPNAPAAFAAYVQKLAQTFPQVKQYVLMNECNQPRFVNPQFDASKANQSGAICGNALALAYDALKAVDSSDFVWGVGLSPRGNDNADADSNVSTSPVKFLGSLGQWYRSSGRTKPIMDGLDFHPYPIPQSMPFANGYGEQNNASVTNLTRIYQAFYDGFKGTGQPTIGPGGLKVSLNEVGIQTTVAGHDGYTGAENADGVNDQTGSEAFQADWYSKMLAYVACDPNVAAVNFFHLVDEADLAGWQSGLFYRGYVPRASAAAVQKAIASGLPCVGGVRNWTPGAVASGPKAKPGPKGKPAPKAKPGPKGKHAPKAKPKPKQKPKPASKGKGKGK